MVVERTVGEALAQARLPVRHVVSSHVAALWGFLAVLMWFVLAVVVDVRNELKENQSKVVSSDSDQQPTPKLCRL